MKEFRLPLNLPRICALAVVLAWLAALMAYGTPAAPETPRANCPTTRPPEPLFIPPARYLQKPPGEGSFWFGTEKLWTLLPADGIWQLGHYTPTDPRYRQKTFWWRKGYHWRANPTPPLMVRGRRLDAPAPTFVAKRATNGYRDDWNSFMVVGLDIPTVGCWEITGRYEADSLTYVIWVTPQR